MSDKPTLEIDLDTANDIAWNLYEEGDGTNSLDLALYLFQAITNHPDYKPTEDNFSAHEGLGRIMAEWINNHEAALEQFQIIVDNKDSLIKDFPHAHLYGNTLHRMIEIYDEHMNDPENALKLAKELKRHIDEDFPQEPGSLGFQWDSAESILARSIIEKYEDKETPAPV